jgi:hypothetical protein
MRTKKFIQKFPLDVQGKIESANFFFQKLKDSTRTKSKAWTNTKEHLCYLDGFLFEIIGCKDAFLCYLNNISGNPLKIHQVSEGCLLQKLTDLKISNNILAVVKELAELKNNPTSWMHILSEYRNITTHRRLLPRIVEMQINLKFIGDSAGTLSFSTPFAFRDGDIISFPLNNKVNSKYRKLLLYQNPSRYEKEDGNMTPPDLTDTIGAVEYCNTTLKNMTKLLGRLYSKTLYYQ